jgi:segregation and condensation protein A
VSEVERDERETAGTPGGETRGGFPVSLPTFEGPLDLLLHLCQKHELDILDIPIAFVTEKYLEYLAVMTLMNLDVASEYLVMAATLAHIKSKSLLPAPPPGQEDDLTAEEEDPREALIKRLLEYQKYKAAAEDLQSRGVAGRDIFLRGASIEEVVHTGLPPLAQVPLFSLVEAFQAVLEKSKVKLTHDIVHERITLADRINELVDLLRVKRRMTFEEFFDGATTRFDLVITFLALLEMTKLRMTRLYQADFNSQIYVEFSAQVTGDDETQENNAPPSDEDTDSVPPEHDADDKTIIDAAPPEIDDLLAPDEDSAASLHANDETELPEVPEGADGEQVTREMLSPPVVADASDSEADMLLASLGEDTSEDVTAEPPSSDEEPAPISQDVPPLEDES